MRNKLTLGFVLLAGFAFTEPVSAWDSIASCSESVNIALEKAGIDRADILSQDTFPEGTNGRTPSLDGWRSWLKMKSCDGNIVVIRGETVSSQMFTRRVTAQFQIRPVNHMERTDRLP